MMSFCLKCKRNTDSINAVKDKTKNNRLILKSECGVCGSKKSQFLKEGRLPKGPAFGSRQAGMGLFNNALGNLGVELHLPASTGEDVANGSFNNMYKYSYCGPGTKYEQRNREGYKGINELDRMCKLHDQFYNENTDTASRNISDEALAHRANEIANSSGFDDEQKRFARYVAFVMKNKARFGLGLRSKNVKKGP